MAMSNLYAYGRLAWDPSLDSEDILATWTRLTFGFDPSVLNSKLECPPSVDMSEVLIVHSYQSDLDVVMASLRKLQRSTWHSDIDGHPLHPLRSQSNLPGV